MIKSVYYSLIGEPRENDFTKLLPMQPLNGSMHTLSNSHRGFLNSLMYHHTNNLINATALDPNTNAKGVISIKPVSHQSYDRLAARFTAVADNDDTLHDDTLH